MRLRRGLGAPLPISRSASSRKSLIAGVSCAALIAAALLIGPQGVRMRHGDDVVAGIDKMNFAGHAGRKLGEEIEAGAAEIVEGDAAAQRRVALLEGEHHARIADAGAR